MPLQNDLVSLANFLGEPARELAILAEGNVSGRVDDTSFWVKASGFSMETLGEDGLVQCKFAPITKALIQPNLSDQEVRELLQTCRFNPGESKMPSVETFMHAYLLSLPGIEIVGHTHPVSLLGLLTLREAKDLARVRLFPDDVVCCGPASAFVPYVDPGLPLALAIKAAVESHTEEFGELPKTIWMQNHGLIVLGKNMRDIQVGTQMTDKSARVSLSAMATGRPISQMTESQIQRIHTRPDEHYRQRLLAEMSKK